MVRLIGSVLVFGLLLNGCAGLAVKEIQSYKIEKKREPLALDMPAPLELQDVDWIIITKENADEVLKIALTKELKKTEWVEVDMSKKDDKSQASIQ